MRIVSLPLPGSPLSARQTRRKYPGALSSSPAATKVAMFAFAGGGLGPGPPSLENWRLVISCAWKCALSSDVPSTLWKIVFHSPTRPKSARKPTLPPQLMRSAFGPLPLAMWPPPVRKPSGTLIVFRS